MTPIQEVTRWMDKTLPCVFGAREFKNGRYFITELKSPLDIIEEFSKFKTELLARKTVAGLFVITDPCLVQAKDVAQQVRQCADYVAPITDIPVDVLINGAMLAFSFELPCPVTGVMTTYTDFDAVAFTPLSANPADELYDPSVSAPHPLFNINSDIYAFSMFARDISIMMYHKEPVELARSELEILFDKVEQMWQRYSVATVKGFEKISDQNVCPFRLSHGEKYYLAAHQDPAFAELKKVVNYHDMPLIYAPKLTAKWREAFSTGKLDLTCRSLTPYGVTTIDA